MIIECVTVEAFKGLADGTYELSPGLTVIQGPNEAGKSSLQEAILAGLFGDAASTAKRWQQLHSWQAGRKCSVQLQLDVDGKRYGLKRDFENRRQELVPADGGAVVSGRDPVRARLTLLAGLGSEATYTTTACLQQQELAQVRAGAELRDMLQETVTGGEDDASVSEALRRVDRELNDKFRRGRRGGEKGLWLATNDALTEARERLARITEEVSRTVKARETIATYTDEFEQKKKELTENQVLLQRVQEAKKKQEEYEDLDTECRALQKRIQRARELSDDIAGRERDLEGLPSADIDVADSLKSAAKRQSEMEHEIGQTEQRISGLQAQEQELSQGKTEAQAASTRRRGAGIALAVSTAVAAVALWQALAGVTAFWAILAVAAVGAGVSVAVLISARTSGSVHDLDTEISSLRGRLSTMQEHLQALQDSHAESGKSVEETLQRAQMDSIDKYVEVANQRDSLTKQNRTDSRILEELLGGDDCDKLEESLDRLSLDRRALEQELREPEMLAADMSPEQMRELEDNIAHLKQEVPQLDDELREARAIITQSSFDVEDETRVGEQVEALQEQVARLAEYEQVLALAADVMEEARRQSMHSAVDTLGPTIKQYLSDLTGGRYEEVEIQGDELVPAVYSRDKSDFVNPDEELSLATKEQLYLAWRLALAGLLWQETAPPVLLDDPLVNFDDDRKGYALQLLGDIAQTRQVVLFTCSDEYDGVAESVVHLQGPSL